MRKGESYPMNGARTTLITNAMSFIMFIENVMLMMSLSLATGVVVRSSFWYAGSNRRRRKLVSLTFDVDSAQSTAEISIIQVK